ncbi:hypothetical protein IWX50DRAFT_50288 [Phyllosticta citricarpa]
MENALSQNNAANLTPEHFQFSVTHDRRCTAVHHDGKPACLTGSSESSMSHPLPFDTKHLQHVYALTARRLNPDSSRLPHNFLLLLTCPQSIHFFSTAHFHPSSHLHLPCFRFAKLVWLRWRLCRPSQPTSASTPLCCAVRAQPSQPVRQTALPANLPRTTWTEALAPVVSEISVQHARFHLPLMRTTGGLNKGSTVQCQLRVMRCKMGSRGAVDFAG